MEYNPPKLFYKVVARQRFDETKASEIFKESPFYDYDPTYLDIFYKTDINEKDKVILNNIGDKKNQFEWHSKSCLVISDDLFKEYFDGEKYYSGSDKFLARLNLDEYNKLLELIDDYSTDISKSLKGDSVATKILEKKVDSLLIFKGKFIGWFIDRKITFPIAEPTESFDDALSMSPYQLEELTTVIQEQVEYLVMIARKDKRKGIQEKWKSKILKDFERNNPYGVIRRIMDKFKEKYSEEKFNINGMSWYKKPKKHLQ